MLRDDLTDVPLGELSVLRKRIGDKKFAQLYRSKANETGRGASSDAGETEGNDADQDRDDASQAQADRSYSTGRRSDWPSNPTIQKRANHNQPIEVSTRRPTAFRKERLREFCARSSYLTHSNDPRFDERCGDYNEHAFRATHSFLDTIRQQEKEQLERTRQRLKKGIVKAKFKASGDDAVAGNDDLEGTTSVVSKKHEELEKVDYLLERFRQRELAEKRTALRKRVRDQVVRNERERVAAGKQPYFPKRSELRKLELFERFKELRKAGRLDSFLKKKRKRESSKQKRKLDVQL